AVTLARTPSGHDPPGGFAQAGNRPSAFLPANPLRPPPRSRASPPQVRATALVSPAPTILYAANVAPHAGAWIETHAGRRIGRARLGRPPRGGVDRNDNTAASLPGGPRRPPRGGVDRNVGTVEGNAAI